MKWSSYSGRRSTTLGATFFALALSATADPLATNRVAPARLLPEPSRKGAEIMMHTGSPGSSPQPAAIEAIPDDRMGAQTGYRPVPTLIKPAPRYGFGDRGQPYDPLLGRPPGLILF